MSTVLKKSFNNPDEARAPDRAKVSVCNLGEIAAAKLVLQPGWSWEICVKPMVGGKSCQAKHVGTVMSGQMAAKHNDGTEQVFGPGEVFVIDAGHNGWVVGEGEVVAFEVKSTQHKHSRIPIKRLIIFNKSGQSR